MYCRLLKRYATIIVAAVLAACLSSCTKELVVTEPFSEQSVLVGIEKTEYIFRYEDGALDSLMMRITFTDSTKATQKLAQFPTAEIDGRVITYAIDDSQFEDWPMSEVRDYFEGLGCEVK